MAEEFINDFKDYKKQVFFIGVVLIGASIFGFFQLAFFNTYIEGVLNLGEWYIALMVSLASIVGLIFFLVFGVISDNTRTKYGRRRPYLLLGIISGIAMISFGFVQDYIVALIIRVLIIEISINAYYAVQRTLIADLIPVEHRGKANGITANLAMLGMIIAVGAMIYVSAVHVKGGNLSQEGHLILYIVGGISIILCAAVGFIFIKEPNASDLPERKGFFEDIQETLNIDELKKHREYLKMMLAQSVLYLGLLLVAPYIFIYIFDLELSVLELVIVALVLLPVIASTMYILGKLADKIGRKKVLPPTIAVSSIGFIMIPFVAAKDAIIFPLLIVAVCLALIGFNGVMVPINAWQQDLLPEEKRAQFNGIMNIVYTVLSIPGAIIGAIIYSNLGIHWIFAFVPIFLILSIPFFLKIEETIPDRE
ncbi:MAG: MFS transporter [Promethearchaeota archaeon]